MQIDYRAFLDKLWEAMPADAFVAMASDPMFLGNPCIKTQHFIGVTKWVKESETQITGHHQMRVAHQKYKDKTMTEVVVKGHAHGSGSMTYRKMDGMWKFAGILPDIRWSEYDHDRIFLEGAEKFGKETPRGEKPTEKESGGDRFGEEESEGVGQPGLASVPLPLVA